MPTGSKLYGALPNYKRITRGIRNVEPTHPLQEMKTITLLPPEEPLFPAYEMALNEPDGLLAAGGRLNVDWLTEAYSKGIFPWFNSDNEEILWWCPSERAILYPGTMHISRSLKKAIKKGLFDITYDRNFSEVVENCSRRNDQSEATWITETMKKAYYEMYLAGLAHSVEVTRQGELVGGIYGITLGSMYFGESMFSRVDNASKIAMYYLQKKLYEWRFTLIDCQIMNPHLRSLGAITISREQFIDLLKVNTSKQTITSSWAVRA